ncbi:m137 protein [Murid betaherpesvirus 1]|uniref:M137 protein n=1 Tax=Murid herpesvirus 1 TaxID=10366 RepID=H2A2X6_MUHV1|nr:m137 protein [Murid betaherpesvirus 1]
MWRYWWYRGAIAAIVAAVTTTALIAPGGWDPSGLSFEQPEFVRNMYDTQPTVLNCSLTTRFSRGVVGWVKCSGGQPKKRCRSMWVEYVGDTDFAGEGVYDDGFRAPITARVRKSEPPLLDVDLGIELEPRHENLGGHACVVVPHLGVEDSSVTEHISRATFILTARVRRVFVVKDSILSAKFHMSSAMVSRAAGTILLRLREGPEVHFETRLDHIKSAISNPGLNFSKTTERENVTTFALTAKIDPFDLGFSMEVDDGQGGFVGRSGVELERPARGFWWKVTQMTTIVATVLLALLGEQYFVTPHTEKAFIAWCAMFIGWVLRGLIDREDLQEL